MPEIANEATKTAWTLSPHREGAPTVFASNAGEARHLIMHQLQWRKWPAGLACVPAEEAPARHARTAKEHVKDRP